jgi:hypothetical protein
MIASETFVRGSNLSGGAVDRGLLFISAAFFPQGSTYAGAPNNERKEQTIMNLKTMAQH